jgi:hypothetical protein
LFGLRREFGHDDALPAVKKGAFVWLMGNCMAALRSYIEADDSPSFFQDRAIGQATLLVARALCVGGTDVSTLLEVLGWLEGALAYVFAEK